MGEEVHNEAIVKPGMKEYHTGHLPQPKLPTLKGISETAKLPQRAEFGVVQSVGPRVQRAIVWAPPVTKYTSHYSKVESYYTDLNKQLGRQEESD